MTAEFKVGDKVEYIEDHDGRTAGTKGTVTRAFEGNNLIVVTDEFGAENHAFRSRFKHAEKLAPLTYKGLTVGDKVRYTGTYWTGLEGTVSGFNDGLVDLICTKFPDTHSIFSSLKLGKSICATSGGKGVSASDLEKIEPTFKVGDVVKVIGKVSGFEAQTVTVVTIDSFSSTYLLRVKRADGQTCPVWAYELEHITEPKVAEVTTIKYADIQVGDKIKRTRNYLSGAVEAREGVVNRKGDGYLSDDSALVLAYSTDDSKKGVVLELLERATPEPKPEDLLVDGAKIGAQIVITKPGGVRKLYRKAKENLWETVVIKEGSVHIGFNWSDKEMKINLEGSDAKRVKY